MAGLHYGSIVRANRSPFNIVFLNPELDNVRAKWIMGRFDYNSGMVYERIPYGRQQFALNLLLFLILLVLAPLVLISIGGTDVLVLAGLLGLIILLILVFAVSPMITTHEINDRSLILRQGLYFRAEIPLRNISSVRRIDTGPRRTGIWFRTFGSVLYVTTRRYDLVEVELRNQQRFGWAFWKRADTVVFDTVDNPGLIGRMEAAGITPSSPALRS